MSFEDMTLSEQIERLKVGWLAAEQEAAALRAEVERLREALSAAADFHNTEVAYLRAEVDRLKQRQELLVRALIRLRDCDWIITPHDRMDAVRDIARNALEPKQEELK